MNSTAIHKRRPYVNPAPLDLDGIARLFSELELFLPDWRLANDNDGAGYYEVAPDFEKLRRFAAWSFINELLDGTTGDVYVCSLPNDKGGKPGEKHIATRDVEKIVSFVNRWDKAGRAIYYSIGTIVRGKPRAKENVVENSFVGVDFDARERTVDDIVRSLRALPLPPSRIHLSGRGVHGLWRLTEPCTDNGRFDAAALRVRDALGGDTAFTPHGAALMRLPSSHNTKGGAWLEVTVADSGGRSYALDELDAWAATGGAANPYLADTSGGFKPPMDAGAELAAMAPGNIHDTQLRAMASLLNGGASEDEAVEVVMEATRRVGDASWDWAREQRDVRKMGEDWRRKRAADRSAKQTQKTIGGKELGVFASWADLEPDSYDWLWRHWLARGELQLIAGAVSAGKTTVALSFAATVTSGGKWPNGDRCEAGRVLFWSGEDSIEKALMPRFMAMGGDLSRIGAVDVVKEDGKKRRFDPASDTDLLREALERQRQKGEPVSLIVIDPFIVIAKTDSHKNAETRRDMQPLVDLAREFDAAILGVTHYTKGSQRQAVNERVTGSLAFGAQARAIFAAVLNDDEAEASGPKRSLIRTKSNFGPSGGGFAYDIEVTEVVAANKPIECTMVKWGDAIDGSAQRLVDEAENGAKGGRGGSALTDALVFLANALAGGPRLAREVEEEAGANLIKSRTLRRAKNELRVTSDKGDGGWTWTLPPGVSAPTGEPGRLRTLPE